MKHVCSLFPMAILRRNKGSRQVAVRTLRLPACCCLGRKVERTLCKYYNCKIDNPLSYLKTNQHDRLRREKHHIPSRGRLLPSSVRPPEGPEMTP